MANKIFSFDAETDGLWGQAFSIGAILYEDGLEKSRFVGRCPIMGEPNPWVAENVLPKMADIPITCESYDQLLKDFFEFYLSEKENSTIIVHMGLPVESRLFLDAHSMGIIGDWDAPYPLIDISAFSEINDSVDSYNKKHDLLVGEFQGGTHNPLYDSAAAAVAYHHLVLQHVIHGFEKEVIEAD